MNFSTEHIKSLLWSCLLTLLFSLSGPAMGGYSEFERTGAPRSLNRPYLDFVEQLNQGALSATDIGGIREGAAYQFGQDMGVTILAEALGPLVVSSRMSTSLRQSSRVVFPESLAARGLATGTDDAVFWSGIGRGGDVRAANWVSQHGGSTLETTMAARGIKLPTWDPNNAATVAAWKQASTDFAAGARGNIRVLQGDSLRIDAIWRDEFKALQTNPNVNSIRSINPDSGAEVLLWSR